jgi:hypothetical protein
MSRPPALIRVAGPPDAGSATELAAELSQAARSENSVVIVADTGD